MWIEAALIILAGMVTIGLSINAIIKSNRQEIETKKYQNESKTLQEELNFKTDEIIKLNKKLKDQSDIHSSELKNLTKPIPKRILLSFEAEIKLSDNELVLFKKHFTSQARQSNIITMEALKKYSIKSLVVEQLLQSGLSMDLKIIGRNSREINAKYNNLPIKLYAIPHSFNNVFMIYYKTETHSIIISGSNINSISCNSSSYTLYDFEDYEIKLDFGFYNPISVNESLMYAYDNHKIIKLDNLSVNLNFENEDGYRIFIPHFIQIKENRFESNGILGLN